MALQEPKSIEKDKELPTSMDFAELKRQGVEEVQRLSGRVWTDYNEHDPGVTILENLCFALTELGYKTNFSVKDLFFKISEEDNKDFLSTFYQPEEILPPAPITIRDFRKLVIDHVKGIKNVWINPKKQSQVGTRINGLYEVLILIDESIKDKKSIKQEVEKLLSSYRNLGEDFDVFRVLEFEEIYFKANISISPDAIGESIYANILSKVQSLFSPTIPFYSEEEIMGMEQGKEIIINHPPVKNGYVLDTDLDKSELKNISKLFTSKVIQTISEIDGIEEVFDFVFYINGEQEPSEIIQLDDYKVPSLNVDKIINDNTISLFAGDIEYNADQNVIKYTYEIEKNRKALKHKRYNEKPTEEITSNKKKDDILNYISIQNSFPKAYGITDYGLEGKVTDERKAQVKQLRAYLYFFEQIMANYLAQLANVDKFFSTTKNLDKQYFYQPIVEQNKYNELVSLNGSTDKIPFDQINSQFDNYKERRNRILDHLLARFGEEFLLEAYNAIHRESSSLAKSHFLDENIEAKIKYLDNYVDISRNKAKGFDYMEDFKNPENVSGLQKRIALLFNFKNFGFQQLSTLAVDKSLKISDKKSNPTKSAFAFNSEEPNFLADVLAFGIERNNYRIAKEKDFVIYFQNRSTRKEHAIFKAKTITEAEEALTKLIDRLKEINGKSEGFHVLEHILLRDVNAAFRFIYISEKNIELTSEFNYTDSSYSQTEFVSNLLNLGSTKTNYTVKKTGDLYNFIISKKSSKFQVTSENFSSKKDAESAISAMINEFSNTKIIDSDLDLRIHLDQDMSNIKMYDEDPYSLQISFICPRWSGRFRSEKMKYLFENVVKLNAPAHLKVNFHWLSIPDMDLFEKPFTTWMTQKHSTKDRKTLDKLSSYLLLLMKKFGNVDIVDKDLDKELKKLKSELKL